MLKIPVKMYIVMVAVSKTKPYIRKQLLTHHDFIIIIKGGSNEQQVVFTNNDRQIVLKTLS